VPPSIRRSVLCLCAAFVAAMSFAAATSAVAASSHLGDRTLRAGASGPDVKELQKALGKAGFTVKADGQFGGSTKTAVKRFQRAARLTASGTVGRKTVAALQRALRGSGAHVNGGFDPDDPSTAASHKSLGDRIPVQRGMSGHDIRVLQGFLRKAGFQTSVDGEFGAGTEKAVKAFETAQTRTVDGIMDAADIDALRALTKQGGASPAAGTPVPATQPVALAPGDRAQIGPDGLAIAPASAPDPVKAMIAAGNQIAKMPYRYGGGHASFTDTGYDCSGSVSYALHGAGLLAQALPSGNFVTWGDPGPGQWVTLYAKASHMYAVIGGLRFDTSGRANNGTRWQTDMRSTAGYTARHPTGL
jgi:peptidoglycan hydrolase-like protein with peptidoglycan-binding domain